MNTYRSSFLLSALVIPAALASLSGCAPDNGFAQVKDYGGVYESSISGRVCDPARNVWLEGATVYTNIIVDGELVGTASTLTDVNGNWQLAELRSDLTYTIYVQYGSTVLDQFDVEVADTQDIVLDDPTCSSAVASTVAIVSGDYDELSKVMTRFGVSDFYEVNGQTGDDLVEFLQSAENLTQYQAILFAGGHTEEDVFYDTDGSDTDGNVPRVLQALRDYVSAGGTVWGTDWSYDVIEQAWPDPVNWHGDDGVPNAAQIGTPGSINADIPDSGLSAAVGGSHVTVAYDLDTWPIIDATGGGVTTLEVGDAPWRFGMDTGTVSEAALALQFASGKGQVIYTTWTLDANAGDGEEVIRYLVDSL